MGEWYVDKGIDLSLILTVLICTASVLISVIKGWLVLHDRTRDLEGSINNIKQENRRLKEWHERDYEVLKSAIDTFASRIEKAIDKLSEKIDAKADK